MGTTLKNQRGTDPDLERVSPKSRPRNRQETRNQGTQETNKPHKAHSAYCRGDKQGARGITPQTTNDLVRALKRAI